MAMIPSGDTSVDEEKLPKARSRWEEMSFEDGSDAMSAYSRMTRRDISELINMMLNIRSDGAVAMVNSQLWFYHCSCMDDFSVNRSMPMKSS